MPKITYSSLLKLDCHSGKSPISIIKLMCLILLFSAFQVSLTQKCYFYHSTHLDLFLKHTYHINCDPRQGSGPQISNNNLSVHRCCLVLGIQAPIFMVTYFPGTISLAHHREKCNWFSYLLEVI